MKFIRKDALNFCGICRQVKPFFHRNVLREIGHYSHGNHKIPLIEVQTIVV